MAYIQNTGMDGFKLKSPSSTKSPSMFIKDASKEQLACNNANKPNPLTPAEDRGIKNIPLQKQYLG